MRNAGIDGIVEASLSFIIYCNGGFTHFFLKTESTKPIKRIVAVYMKLCLEASKERERKKNAQENQMILLSPFQVILLILL